MGKLTEAPDRAHTLILKAGADTATELAWHLRHMADDIERDRLSVGCSGGPSSGSTYSYRVRPEQTHDVYFQQIDEWLEQERFALPVAKDPSDAR